jgi:type IV secretory pathway VirB10-like protein
MTTAADDVAAEEAFEAFLAGRPVPEAVAGTFAGVAAFADAVRTTATGPGRPNAALAELLVTGLLTDQTSPSTVTARSAGKSLRRPSRVRRRRRSAMFFFPALVAKILSAGAIAQAATGAGIVVVAFTGAGAAGVLPGPVQDTVATVVETVTPFDLPHSHDPVKPEDTTPAPTLPTATTTSEDTENPPTETPETEPTEPAGPTSTASNSFGKRVSEDAKDGGVDGQEISREAHERNEARKSGSTATRTAARTEDDDQDEDEDGSGKTRASSGRTSDDGGSSKHGGSGDD